MTSTTDPRQPRWYNYWGWGSGDMLGAGAQAVATLTWLLVAGPILVMLAGLLASWNFRLNARTHGVLMAEIERLRAGERTPSSEEARGVVEDLSGWSYDKLWGNNPVAGRRV